jgi:hypothetical protein
MTNQKDAENFENYLCGVVDGERNYTTIHPRSKKVLSFHGSLSSLEVQLAAANDNGAGVFTTVNPLRGAKRLATEVVSVHGLFLDLDGAALDPVLKVMPAPHIIVETSPGKFHVHWAVHDCHLDQFKTCQVALASRFDGDPAVCDLPRLARVPGYKHQKLDKMTGKLSEPFLSHIIAQHHDPAYSLTELFEPVGAVPVSAPKQAANSRFDAQQDVDEGGRNTALTRHCGRLINEQLSEREALAKLTKWNRAHCIPPLPDDEVEQTYASILKTDAMNATPAKAVVQQLNQQHAIVSVEGKLRVLKEGPMGVSYSSVGDFHSYYLNLPKVEGSSATKVWMSHPDRRTYEGLVFDPAYRSEYANHYNLWQGFAVEPAEGDCSLYLELILTVICCGNEQHYNYLIRWMAHAVQCPGQLPGVAVVLMGGRGAGKGCSIQPFGRLFGRHFASLNTRESFMGRFNAHMQDKMVMFADEVFWSGDKSQEGALKTMITEHRRPYEAKGLPLVELDNFARVVMATNDTWAVPAGHDERRYLVLEVSGVHKQDTTYFGAIDSQMRSGGDSALLHMLLHLDLTGFDVRDVPQTNALAGQKLKSLDPLETWWHDCLDEGSIGFCDESGRLIGHSSTIAGPTKRGLWPSFAATSALYEAYTDHSKKLGRRYPLSTSEFGKRFIQLAKVSSIRPNIYGSRVRGYDMPSLCGARQEFCNFLGHELVWE